MLLPFVDALTSAVGSMRLAARMRPVHVTTTRMVHHDPPVAIRVVNTCKHAKWPSNGMSRHLYMRASWCNPAH